MKRQHLEEWEHSRKGLSRGGWTLSSLFGGSSEVRTPLMLCYSLVTWFMFVALGRVSSAAHLPGAEATRGAASVPRGTRVHAAEQGELRQAHQGGAGGHGARDAEHLLGCRASHPCWWPSAPAACCPAGLVRSSDSGCARLVAQVDCACARAMLHHPRSSIYIHAIIGLIHTLVFRHEATVAISRKLCSDRPAMFADMTIVVPH